MAQAGCFIRRIIGLIRRIGLIGLIKSSDRSDQSDRSDRSAKKNAAPGGRRTQKSGLSCAICGKNRRGRGGGYLPGAHVGQALISSTH